MVRFLSRIAMIIATWVWIGASISSSGCAGSGSLSNTTLVGPTPRTLGATGPYHIATWAYDDSSGQGTAVSASTINQLVSYAQGDQKSLADCHSISNGCKAVFYFDPNHLFGGTSCTFHPDSYAIAASSESWFVHDTGYTDASHRVHGVRHSGCYVWEMNPNSSDSQSWWRNYLQRVADNYDLYVVDDDSMDVIDAGYFSHTGGGCLPYPSFCHSTQEIPNDAAEVVARANFVNAMNYANGSPMHFFFQQASFAYALDLSAFTASNRFVGMTCEGCIATTLIPIRPNMYKPVLDEMALVNATPASYLLISRGSFPAGSATQILQRLVTLGIVWLAYSEGHTVVQPDLEFKDTSNLAIWPEDLIYPSHPTESMVTSSNDLQVSPGVYRREFATCYQRGVAFGRCAAVVNSTASTVTVESSWLQQTYRHVITLAGGDVLSGGTADVTDAPFVPNSTSVQPGGTVLLAQ